MNTKTLFRTLCFSAVTVMSGMSAADDIDIYLTTTASKNPADVRYWPAVMFSFDITTNANATFCQVDVKWDVSKLEYAFSSGNSDCDELIDGGYLNENSVAGLPEADPVADWTVNNHAINRHELYGMALRKAIDEVVPSDQGLRIAMMLPHQQEQGASAQSNGGFIPIGFGPLQAEVNAAASAAAGSTLDCTSTTLSAANAAICTTAAFTLRDQKFDKFREVAVKTSALLRGLHGGFGARRGPNSGIFASWAGAEMYLELYRYVKGARTFRADFGNVDFGTGSSQNSLEPDADNSGWPNPWTTSDTELYDRAIAGKVYDVDWHTHTSLTPANRIISVTKPGSQVLQTYNAPELECSGVSVINFLLSQSSVHEPTRSGGNKDNDFYNTAAQTFACTDPAVCGIGVTTAEINAETSPNDVTKAVWRRMNEIDLLADHAGGDPEGVQGFTSYLIVNSSNPSTADRALAEAGGGVAYAGGGSLDDLVDAIKDALLRILTDSTTFTAPALTANALNRTDILNDVFLSLFNADSGAIWPGNIKKLRLAVNSLGDPIVAGVPDVDPGTGAKSFTNAFQGGLIAGDVTSYWTDVNTLPTLSDYNEEATDTTDGRMVPRGGTGQLLEANGSRTIYTEPASGVTVVSGGTTPVVFNGTSAPSLSGAQRDFIEDPEYSYASGETWKMGATLHSRPAAINYGYTTSQRETQENPDVRIVFGGNDGLFRMIQNTNDTTDDIELNGAVQSGEENWAFIPREVFQAIPRMRQESGAGTSYPGIPITVDGPPLIIQVDANKDGKFTVLADLDGDGTIGSTEFTNDIVWAFFGLRRGGKYYYALNLIEPGSPKFMWKIGKSDTDGNGDGVLDSVSTWSNQPTNAFAEMAQAWSYPQFGVMEVKATSLPGNLCPTGATECNVPILAFGGGYNGDDYGLQGDECTTPISGTTNAKENLGDDAANRGCSLNLATDADYDDNEGNAVFIVHAETGALIWKLTDGTGGYSSSLRAYRHPEMDDSVPADVRLEDKNADGLADTLYFVTSGGTLWRVNLADMSQGDVVTPDPSYVFDDTNPAFWRPYRLLTVGRHHDSGAGSRYDRRFLIQPAVASTRDDDGSYDAILIGSGDREDPTDTNNVDVMYMYKDAATGKRDAPFRREPDDAVSGNSYKPGPNLPLTDKSLAWIDTSGNQSDPDTGDGFSAAIENGWRRQVTDPSDGEKVVGGALVIGGIAFFTTYLPVSNSSNPCVPSAGQGRLYALGLGDGDAALDLIPNNGVDKDPYMSLDTPGIPPPAISIGPGPGGGDTDKIYIQGEIIDTETRAFFPTFWRRDEN